MFSCVSYTVKPEPKTGRNENRTFSRNSYLAFGDFELAKSLIPVETDPIIYLQQSHGYLTANAALSCRISNL
jgi:hypothetical protein